MICAAISTVASQCPIVHYGGVTGRRLFVFTKNQNLLVVRNTPSYNFNYVSPLVLDMRIFRNAFVGNLYARPHNFVTDVYNYNIIIVK